MIVSTPGSLNLRSSIGRTLVKRLLTHLSGYTNENSGQRQVVSTMVWVYSSLCNYLIDTSFFAAYGDLNLNVGVVFDRVQLCTDPNL
jgi:hypothetical protein